MSSTDNPFERDPFAAEHNPFAAPQAMDHVLDASGPQLATRSARFAGAFLDGLLMLPVTFGFPAVYTFYIAEQNAEMTNEAQILFTVVMVVASVVWFLLLNGHLLANRGQTIGKLAAKTRIVNLNTGELVPFWPLILKRWLLLQLIGVIPFIGPFILLIGILLIFRSNRRCLHDEIAGTKVVAVQ